MTNIKQNQSTRQRLAEWSKTPEGRESYEKVAGEMRREISEKPMNQEELEKAVVDYFEGYWPGMETAEQCNTDLRFTPPAIMRLARHFAQWGYLRAAEKADEIEYNRQRAEESVPKDLEEAAEDFVWEVMENDEDGISDLCRKLRPTSKISDFYDALAEFFIAGAKWQKEQDEKEEADLFTIVALDAAQRAKEKMMKEAVDADVNIYRDIGAGKSWAEFVVEMPTSDLGDKVRIIILPKEAEQ